jgi:acyl-CoA thioester hydrolase
MLIPSIQYKVMWSQIDANFHLRHSAYADLAAQARVEVLEQFGLSAATMQQLHLGPILFREETIYHREINMNELVTITCLLKKCTKDGARWAFEQHLYKENQVKAATIIAEGAWMDAKTRKYTTPPSAFQEALLENLTRTENFEWMEKKSV